jgi:hypothetical protein
VNLFLFWVCLEFCSQKKVFCGSDTIVCFVVDDVVLVSFNDFCVGRKDID